MSFADWFGLIMNIITAISLVSWIVYYFYSFKWKINEIDWKLNTISKNSTKIESLDKFIDDLSRFFYSQNNTCVPNNLKDYKRYYQSGSPLRLNDEWVKFIKESWFLQLFDTHKDYFLSWIRGKLYWKESEDSFFYFVEKFSIDFIFELEKDNHSYLDSVRKYIFNNGLTEIKKILFTALWLFVRDEVIKDFWRWDEFVKIRDEGKTN